MPILWEIYEHIRSCFTKLLGNKTCEYLSYILFRVPNTTGKRLKTLEKLKLKKITRIYSVTTCSVLSHNCTILYLWKIPRIILEFRQGGQKTWKTGI